ncbi:MAG: hypothetical protein A2901_08065 [Elusimicrobia bacterium RIFCSPLOWO2_01_FULL_54_10]|nr:MAG: hypothetical protein A2901_08065 [Elusimicrobia bacterium RIFCSPLOWO2_01_FULL_54_10]
MPRPNLSMIERDKKDVSLHTIRALACALDVSAGTLVDGRAPQDALKVAKALSRDAMEKIARSVLFKGELSGPWEQALADNLRIVLGPRLRALNPGYKASRRIGRNSERAWLALSALPPSERDSLIQRVVDHAAIA